MGRQEHQRLPALVAGEHVTDKECEKVAVFSGFPLFLVKEVLQDKVAISASLAARLRKALAKEDSWRVSSGLRKEPIKTDYSVQQFGLPPKGYRGPINIPSTKVEMGMLLQVADRLSSGWLEVTDKPRAVKNGQYSNDIELPTRDGIVYIAKKLSVRVAVQADGDSLT